MEDPTPRLFLVATDANDGLYVIATNLAQAVDEYWAMKLTPPPTERVYPALHVHAACALLVAGDELLVGQLVHVPELVAATAVEYVFVPQSVHAADPVSALYLPAAQPEQVPPSGPVNPMLHVQAPIALLPDPDELLAGQLVHTPDPVAPGVVEYVPAPQSVHVAVPVEPLYLPAKHDAHGPPFGPVAPALQVQLAKVPLPAGELEFVGHALQVALAEAPTAVEYVPAPQSEHTVDPGSALYLPATQAVQVPPFEPEYPELQVQLDSKVDPSGELEFAGQAVHPADPVDVLYAPAPHCVQAVPSEPV